MAVEVIDAHVHVWDLADRPQPWTDEFPALQRSFSAADLEPELAPGERIILVQTVASFDESLELLRRAAGQARIAGVVGWVDLTLDAEEQIRVLRSAVGGTMLVGLRHQLQLEPDPNWLGRSDVRNGLRAAGEAGLAFDVVVSAESLPQVIDCVAALPAVRFVLDHAGKPPLAGTDGSLLGGGLADWAADVLALAALPNLAVKVSGLVTEADWAGWTQDQLTPVIEHVVRSFGSSRVMFGSDWPVCLLAADYRTVRQTLLPTLDSRSVDEADAIWGGTASAWYRLGRT